jgi:hypothetical protein
MPAMPPKATRASNPLPATFKHKADSTAEMSVETLGDFAGGANPTQAWHQQAGTNLPAGDPVCRNEKEVFERHLAHLIAAPQLQCGIERNQHRREIADRRAVGDIAATVPARAPAWSQSGSTSATSGRSSRASALHG